VGINGPRRQKTHKKFEVPGRLILGGGIYTDIPPVATPLIVAPTMQTLLARSSANSKLTFFLCALTMFDFY